MQGVELGKYHQRKMSRKEVLAFIHFVEKLSIDLSIQVPPSKKLAIVANIAIRHLFNSIYHLFIAIIVAKFNSIYHPAIIVAPTIVNSFSKTIQNL